MPTFTINSLTDTATDTTTGTPDGSGNASGTLRQAINFANQNVGTPSVVTIIQVQTGLAGTITLAGNLPLVATSISFDGGGLILNGASAYRGFLISGIAADGLNAAATTVSISDLTFQNVRAQGGNGAGRGGGGLGAGGAIFIGPQASVTLTDVSVAGAAAVGGSGGGGYYGGGGGLGGNAAGSGAIRKGAGGGGGLLFGAGAGNPSSGEFGGGGGGGGVSTAGGGSSGFTGGNGGSGLGGLGGGGGGGSGERDNASTAGGQAGGTGASAGGGGYYTSGSGGRGGFGGGGGGGGSGFLGGGNGGQGGFGGGGGGGALLGGRGGNGGFGGGGAGSDSALPFAGVGGFGGGSGRFGSPGFGGGGGDDLTGDGAGGGAGMGGAIFVTAGGSLTINGTSGESNGTVAGGAGAARGGGGAALAGGVFFEGNPTAGAPAVLSFGSGDQSFADAIGDLNGAAGNTTTGNGLGGTGGATAIAKTTAGTLTLSAANFYTGGTTLVTGSILNLAGIAGTPATAGTGVVSGAGAVKVSGAAKLTGTNTYMGGTTLSAGTLELGALGSAGSAAITFTIGAQTLQLDTAGTLANTLTSFGLGDIVDLKTITFAGATMSMSGNNLTVTEAAASGSDSNTLTIGPAPVGYSYVLASDGAGGTNVTLGQVQQDDSVTAITTDPPSGSAVRATKTVVFTLTTETPVTVTGMPQLTLSNGGVATYSGVDGAGKPQFTYTVASGEDTSDLLVTGYDANGGAVTPNDGSTFDSSSVATAPGADTGVIVDTIAPPGPTSLILAPGQDTGSSSSDGVTSVNTFNLSGTAQAGLSLNLYRDTGVLIGTTTVLNDGTYAFTTPALTDGLHSLFTAAVDAAGNRSTTSNLIKVTVDTAAPATPAAPTLSPASDTDTLGDGQTSITQPVVTGIAEAGATVTLYDTDGTTVLGMALASSSGKYAITSSGLADGPHQLRVKATDKAGNTSAASPTTSVTIVRPSAPDMIARSDSGASSTDNITNVRTPTFTGTAAANTTVKLYEGNTLLGTGRSGSNGVYSVTSSALVDGTHTLKIAVTDRSGHASSLSDGLVVKIDTGKPAAPSSPVLTAASDTGASSSDGITSDATPTVTGTAEAGSTVTLYRDNGIQIGSMTLGASATAYSFTTPTLTDGLHSLYATATDAAGNRSATSALRKVTIDTQAPNVAIGGGNRTVNSANQTISGTGEAGSTIALSDNGDVVGTTAVASNGTWSKAVTLSPGQNQLVATDTDTAGNVGTSNTVTVTYSAASSMRSLHSMIQAMSTMSPASSSALTPSAPAMHTDAHLAVAHG